MLWDAMGELPAHSRSRPQKLVKTRQCERPICNSSSSMHVRVPEKEKERERGSDKTAARGASTLHKRTWLAYP